VTVLDHHATAKTELRDWLGTRGIDNLCQLHVEFNMEKSGAVLAWEYFHPNTPVPEFFLYLQDRDLWQWKLPMSREFSAALRSYPMEFRLWSDLCGFGASTSDFHKSDIEMLTDEGRGILRFQKQNVEMQVRAARGVLIELYPDERRAGLERCPIEGVDIGLHPASIGVTARYCVPAVNCTCFISEVCEKLLELYPSAPFAAAYRDTKDGKREWSLRSRKDFDVSTVAKSFGGGGHAQASGFIQSL
jgi:uncharacterized protein